VTCPERCVASRLVEAVRRERDARRDVRATREHIEELLEEAVRPHQTSEAADVLRAHAADLRAGLPEAEAELRASVCAVGDLCAEHERQQDTARYAREYGREEPGA
jgi:hypothetical protein